MKHVIVLQVGELAIKGKNRKWFEDILDRNVRIALADLPVQVRPDYGRVYIYPANGSEFEHPDVVLRASRRIFGVNTVMVGVEVQKEFSYIEAATLHMLESKTHNSFAVRAHRSSKSFGMNSEEINRQLGAKIVDEKGWKVNLSNPELTVYVTITEHAALISLRKEKGAGGLPVGTSGKMISLLSSGIDSPVASYRMMKRGAEVIFLHFHSYPMTSLQSVELVKELVSVLQESQPRSTLILAPLADLQKKIVTDTPAKLRVVLYRRAMLQIAERIGREHGALAIVTGESLGQVASQTLENMAVTAEDINLPVFKPLIGMDKQEIVDQAEALGTYDISIRPYEDCCSLLVPTTVETRANLEQVRNIEQSLPWNAMLNTVIERVEILNV